MTLNCLSLSLSFSLPPAFSLSFVPPTCQHVPYHRSSLRHSAGVACVRQFRRGWTWPSAWLLPCTASPRHRVYPAKIRPAPDCGATRRSTWQKTMPSLLRVSSLSQECTIAAASVRTELGVSLGSAPSVPRREQKPRSRRSVELSATWSFLAGLTAAPRAIGTPTAMGVGRSLSP